LKKLKELREEHRRTGDVHNRIQQDWDELKIKTRTKTLFKEIVDNLEGEVATLREKHFTVTT